ncbi:hypothetical protein ACGFWE_03465 [Streptomyces sp. NPDC048523]
MVGSSARAGDDFNSHAFAYDRSTHAMTDLGTCAVRLLPPDVRRR